MDDRSSFGFPWFVFMYRQIKEKNGQSKGHPSWAHIYTIRHCVFSLAVIQSARELNG